MVDKNDVTKGFTKTTGTLSGFAENDGYNGFWYCNTNTSNNTSTETITAKNSLVAKVAPTNVTFN